MEHGEKASWVGYVANLESVDTPFATCVVLNANFLLTSSRPSRIHTTKELVVSKLIFLIFIVKLCFTNTVLQIQVYPKNNALGVSKPQRVAKSDFLLILKIFLTLDDIRPSN